MQQVDYYLDVIYVFLMCLDIYWTTLDFDQIGFDVGYFCETLEEINILTNVFC